MFLFTLASHKTATVLGPRYSGTDLDMSLNYHGQGTEITLDTSVELESLLYRLLGMS